MFNTNSYRNYHIVITKKDNFKEQYAKNIIMDFYFNNAYMLCFYNF